LKGFRTELVILATAIFRVGHAFKQSERKLGRNAPTDLALQLRECGIVSRRRYEIQRSDKRETMS